MNATPPLVSVLTTVYKRQEHVGCAIESVLAQSLTDLELIVVDDRSPDDSLAIARRYESDPRVSVHLNEENLGDYPNRNRAASLARGKYLKYVDSDDAIYPHCLEVMVHMMERHPEAGMLLCAWSDRDPHYPFLLEPRETYRRGFVHHERISNSPLTMLLRRDAFEQLGGFDTATWPLSCDLDLVLRMAREFPTIVAPTGLAFYRMHGDQVSFQRGKYLRHRTPVSVAIALAALRHPGCPLPEAERLYAVGRQQRLALRFAAGLALKKLRPHLAVKLLGSLKLAAPELPSLMHSRAPVVERPDLGAEPDWADYPRARLDRLEAASSPPAGEPATSIIIAGEADAAGWERTIRSALVQSEEALEVIVAGSGPGLEVAARYPFVRVLPLEEVCPWRVCNAGAEAARGEFVKFVEPGVLLYPYAAEFYAHPLRQHADCGLVLRGDMGYVPHNLVLDGRTAIACDLHPDWSLLRISITCAAIRRSQFIEANGFEPQWGEWAAYELFARLAMRGGAIAGMFGQSSDESACPPGPPEAMPAPLREHLAPLVGEHAGATPVGVPWLEELAGEATTLLDGAVERHAWDWTQYPWADRCNPAHRPPPARSASISPKVTV